MSAVSTVPQKMFYSRWSVKKAAQKEEGVLAFHCYQSLSPGEVTAETTHVIGVELAKRMWGNDFEVLVTTHLDKNTFIIISLSIQFHGQRIKDF